MSLEDLFCDVLNIGSRRKAWASLPSFVTADNLIDALGKEIAQRVFDEAGWPWSSKTAANRSVKSIWRSMPRRITGSKSDDSALPLNVPRRLKPAMGENAVILG